MSEKRKRYTPAEKAKIALEAIVDGAKNPLINGAGR